MLDMLPVTAAGVTFVCKEESQTVRGEYLSIEQGAILTMAMYEDRTLSNRRAAILLGYPLRPDTQRADLSIAAQKMRQLSRVLAIFYDSGKRWRCWRWCKDALREPCKNS